MPFSSLLDHLGNIERRETDPSSLPPQQRGQGGEVLRSKNHREHHSLEYHRREAVYHAGCLQRDGEVVQANQERVDQDLCFSLPFPYRPPPAEIRLRDYRGSNNENDNLPPQGLIRENLAGLTHVDQLAHRKRRPASQQNPQPGEEPLHDPPQNPGALLDRLERKVPADVRPAP